MEVSHLELVRPKIIDLNERNPFDALTIAASKEQWDFSELSNELGKGFAPFHFSEEHLRMYNRMADLPQVEREDLIREINLNFLDLLLFGENLAHAVAGQLILLLPWRNARRAVSLQVMDESRHIDALGFLKKETMGETRDTFKSAPNSNCSAVLTTNSWVEKVVSLQLISENVAVAILRFLISSCRNPGIRNVLVKILSDESRHNYFGRVVLGSDEVISDYGSRERIEDYIITSIEDMIYKEESMMQSLGFCVKKPSSFPTLPFFLARVKADIAQANLLSDKMQLCFANWEKQLQVRI